MTASHMQVVEALVTNVRNLASDDGYKAIASVFDEIPPLKAQIKSKDAELDRLRVKITSLETTHENRVQENLEIYCTQRNKLEEEKAQFSREISTLTANVQQRDVAAKENHQTQDALRGQLDLARKSLDEEKKKVMAANAAITKLQEGLKGKDTGIDKLKEGLQNERAQVSKVKSQLQDLLREKTSLLQELQFCTTRLSEIEGFTTKLREEDEAVW
jgi:chromosome segregation ATPase